MDYKISDVEKSFDGRIAENLGSNDYVVRINGREHQLRILGMDAKGIEFVLDQQYHRARYLETATNEMNLVIDNVPVTLNMNTHFDKVVFKNSGGGAGGSGGGAQTALKSQIPGKVVSIAVAEGDSIKKGEVVCTLESMKMQVGVKAHKDGAVRNLKIKEGATVAKGDVITDIE